MRSLAGYAVAGFALGITTAAAGLTSIPRNWFYGGIIVAMVLAFVFRRNELVLLRAATVLVTWLVGSYVALNHLLPSSMH